MIRTFRFASLLFAASAFLTSCTPGDAYDLDGKSVRAYFTHRTSTPVTLVDADGRSFDLYSPSVEIQLEINFIRNSRLFLRDGNEEVEFRIPNTVFTQRAAAKFVRTEQSGQPVDLRIYEIVKIVDADRDPPHVGERRLVSRKIRVEIFRANANARGFPRREWIGILKPIVRPTFETLTEETLDAYRATPAFPAARVP